MEDKGLTIQENLSPSVLISEAIEKGADLDKLEKLLTLKERYEANEARKAYHKAMSDFKAKPPKIDKDRTVSYDRTKYNYASLANVTAKINTELSKYGLSASWITKQNGTISVTCRITHVLGHSEETTISADADKTGSKNNIQAIGSTITYLERYTLLALTGLATEDMDDDGRNAGGQEFITTAQGSVILDLFTELNLTKEQITKFFVYMKVDKLENLPVKDYTKAISALQMVRGRREAKKTGGKK